MANTISVSILADVANISKGVDQVNSKLGTIGTTGKKVGGLLKGAFAFAVIKEGLGAVKGFVGDALGEAREAQKVSAQTEAVIKSTGGAAGLSAAQFGDLANAISKKTGIDDEQIQAGENMLATFTQVQDRVGKGNDIFTQATKVSTDLSKATGTTQVNANKLLGKALNDPIKGISALTRVGVTFSEGQKKQIAQMIKTGDVAGAQKVILGELNKEFGGSAEAQATAGEKAAVAWGNLKEQLGTALLPIVDKVATVFAEKVAPALSKVAGWLADSLPGALASAQAGFEKIKPALELFGTVLGAVFGFMQKNPETVKAFAITLGILATAVGIITAAQWLWNVAMLANPIGLVIVAIALLVAAIVFVATHLDDIGALFVKVWGGIKALTLTVFNAVKNFLVSVWNSIKSGVSTAVNGIKSVVTSVWNAIKSATSTVWNGIKSLLSTVWNAIKSVVTGQINMVKTVISAVWNFVKSTTSSVWNAVVNTIKSKVADIKSKVTNMRDSVKNIFSNAGNLLKDAGRRIIQGLLDGINRMIGTVKDKLRQLTNLIPSWKGPRERDAVLLRDAGQLIMQSLVDGFDKGETGVMRALRQTTETIASAFDDVMSPTLSPTVSLDTAGKALKGSVSASQASGGNTYTVNVTVPVGGDPVAAGKAITQAITAYEKAGGRRSA